MKRTVYIGLGGFGIDALLITKKNILETFGEVPPMIGFIGIDTDKALWKNIKSIKNGVIHLEDNEYVNIAVDAPQELYERNQNKFDWLSQEGVENLSQLKLGTSGIRSNGRFAFTANKDSVKEILLRTLNNITNIAISDDERYELASSDIDINIVFSLCGGTGSGSFINMAYLIQKYAPKCRIIGYSISPEFFDMASERSLLNANSYAAMCELDYLMGSLKIDSKPIELKYLDGTENITRRPFNEFFYFDNKNKNGETITKDQALEVIGNALIFAGNPSYQSLMDNLSIPQCEGNFNVEGKNSWITFLGNCQIEYQNESLENLSNLCVAKELLSELTREDNVEMKTVAEKWINDHQFGLESYKDRLSKSLPNAQLTGISNVENPLQECAKFIDSNLQLSKEEIENQLADFNGALSTLICETVNQSSGIINSTKILSALHQIVENNLNKLRADDCFAKQIAIDDDLKTACDKLAHHRKGFFRLNWEKLVADVKDRTMELLHCRQNISTSRTLIELFTEFGKSINSQIKCIDDIIKKISLIDEKIAQDKMAVNLSSPFTLSLNAFVLKNNVLELSQLSFSELVQNLPNRDKIYGFHLMNVDDICNSICQGFDGFSGHFERDINAVLNKLSTEEYEKIIKKSLERSEPLMCTDSHGYYVPEICESIFVGVYNKNQSRIKNEDFCKFYKGVEDKIHINIIEGGDKNKISIFHLVHFLPPFCICALVNWEQDYRNSKKDCHIDTILQKRMLDEGYSPYPHNGK